MRVYAKTLVYEFVGDVNRLILHFAEFLMVNGAAAEQQLVMSLNASARSAISYEVWVRDQEE